MNLQIRSEIDPSLTLEKMQYQTEGQYFDRKSNRIPAHHLANSVSAFANASGGIIVIGIEDNGTIVGISDEKENEIRSSFPIS